MIKRLVFFCILVLVVQCGKKDLQSELSLSIPSVPDGETNTYRIMALNDSIGTYTTILEHTWIGEVPAFALTLITHSTTGKVATLDSSFIYVSRNKLVPLSSFRFIRIGSVLTTTAANYGPGSVAVSTYRAGEEKQRLLPYTPKTFDNDELTFLGRALRLEPNKPAKLTILSPMGHPFGGSVREAEFSYGGNEMVTVPAGSFDCRKLVLKTGVSEVEMWYEKSGTKRLIRYRAPSTGITMELLPTHITKQF
ncbi:hypothetical protein CH330_03275 [candidate division WOR-3 bacterium JGI_Cruoil_03_51_56]|uniref:DUF3108 domain-containing protein n=1 Tax=candidate division WOR-3 bacterium JGI_Cruoil_03_51_56 TaxID=1973747 RepID=A0A235BVL0_UNCW3|nr:MAG: hypothetical protein CH330_03275 [candidate division WOR-3 bacterium JGI_Cruoil_03_51_56]